MLQETIFILNPVGEGEELAYTPKALSAISPLLGSNELEEWAKSENAKNGDIFELLVGKTKVATIQKMRLLRSDSQNESNDQRKRREESNSSESKEENSTPKIISRPEKEKEEFPTIQTPRKIS